MVFVAAGCWINVASENEFESIYRVVRVFRVKLSNERLRFEVSDGAAFYLSESE